MMNEPGTRPRVFHFGPRRMRAARRLWHGEDAISRLARAALLPAEAAFRLASGANHAGYNAGLRRAVHLAVPVLSVGNLTVGGAGKTPFTGWLVEPLLRLDRRPAILHGGYAADEPELHRMQHPEIPVFVGRDRVASARAAIAEGADVLVLDDGFQHRRLARALDIVLVAAEQWPGPPRLLPRGGWREPPAALARADLVVVTRKTASGEAARLTAAAVRGFSGAPVASAALLPAGWRTPGAPSGATGDPPDGDAVLVTAVAEWQPVADHARAAGAHLGEVVVFPDHHEFNAADIERIARLAGARPIVTTAKDWVKLRQFPRTLGAHVLELGVRIEDGADQLDAAIAAALAP